MSDRIDQRGASELRRIRIEPGFNKYAEGSALIDVGSTRVLCTASVEERVPDWMRGKGAGWVTAEYSMLPRATHTRGRREVSQGRPSGRTTEIQRLVGRALRAAIDLAALGERTIVVDCDVLQADGGTRCAAVNGGIVALALAGRRLVDTAAIPRFPLRYLASAVSVGRVAGADLLDLAYEEDSHADLDLNVVFAEPVAGGPRRLIEVQGGAEGEPFERSDLDRLIDLADGGAARIFSLQRIALKGAIDE